MFVNFDDIFNEKPQTEIKIPDSLAESLSDELPEGFKYKVNKSGDSIVIVNSDNSEITIGGMSLVPTESQLEILGKNFSFNDILNFAYNSQQKIPIQLQDENIILNGEKLSIDKIAYNPFKPFNLKISEMYLMPKPFTHEFEITIGCAIAILKLKIKRVPNESVNTMAFESQGKSCLSIKYYINLVNQTTSFTINISILNATTVKEIIDSINIYNAFINGEGILAGHHIEEKLKTNNSHEFNKESFIFWQKSYELEKKLGITFKPPFEVDVEDIFIIEEIYQNIIKHNPIRKDRQIASLNIKLENKNRDINNEIGKPIYFETDGTNSFEFCGKKLNFWCIIGIFNAVISNYEENEEDFIIYLQPEGKDKKIYTSILRFLSKSEMEKYKSSVENRIYILKDAKTVADYLS